MITTMFQEKSNMYHISEPTNVNEGTLELKKKTLEIISPSNTASCLLQRLYGELRGC